MLAVSYDISDRKQMEVALRESEDKYRSLFNSMDEGYILVNVIFDENDQPIDSGSGDDQSRTRWKTNART